MIYRNRAFKYVVYTSMELGQVNFHIQMATFQCFPYSPFVGKENS